MKKENGKLIVEKDDFTTCIADSRFIFEMLVNMECFEKDGIGGYVHIRKITHSGTKACLPSEGQQVSIAHGEAMAKWCAGNAVATLAPAVPPAKAPVSTAALKKSLWHQTIPIHKGKKEVLEKWLHDQKILGEAETLEGLTADQLVFCTEKAEIALSQMTP